MKWPNSITLVRHGESAYNALRAKKDESLTYLAFKESFAKNPQSEDTKRRAKEIHSLFALDVSDYGTPLTDEGRAQALATGKKIGKQSNNVKTHNIRGGSPDPKKFSAKTCTEDVMLYDSP